MESRRTRRSEAFQMAPMIDMVFLLLVFFMTVSTMARDARPDLDLPVSTAAVVPDETPPREILTVAGGGGALRYFWNSREIAEPELPGCLSSGGAVEGLQLLIRGAPDLPWSIWEKVLQQCRSAGIREMVFATHEP